MSINFRPARQGDAPECGRIIFEAFKSLADQHGFPPDFVDAATGLVSMLMATPGFHDVLAEEDHQIMGVNFIDMRPRIGGVGPIAVAPEAQNKGLGKALMHAVMEVAVQQKTEGIRLVQAAYNNRSLCLYTGLGFETREPLSVMKGVPLSMRVPGYDVRNATIADQELCNSLCQEVHGFDRALEWNGAIEQHTATVVEHQGKITGYATSVGFFAHAVAESNEDLQALIGDATAYSGPGFLLPTRNYEALKWCLDHGLRLVMQATLMSTGQYSEPTGAYLPSILY